LVNYSAEIAAVEYPFTYLKYKRNYKIEAQPFEVHVPKLESVAIGNVMEIKRDEESVIKGNIIDIWKQMSSERGVSYILKAYDFKRKWNFLPAIGEELADKSWGRPIGTDLTQHLRDQLINTSLTEGTFNNTTKTYPMIYGSTNAKIDRRRVANEILFVTGWEFFANPTGVCDFKSAVGTDLSSTISFKRYENLLAWAEPFKLRGGHKVERIVVEGRNIGDLLIYGIKNGVGYIIGDPEKWINHKTLVSTDACTNAATKLLDDMENNVSYGELEVIDEYTGKAYDVFDTVKIVDDQFGINGNYRLMGFEKEFDSERKGERTILEICDLTHMFNASQILQSGEEHLYESMIGVDNSGDFVYCETEHFEAEIIFFEQIEKLFCRFIELLSMQTQYRENKIRI